VGVSFSFYWPSLGLFFAALEANPMSQLFRSSSVETRLLSESLEPFIGILAYLDPKLCHKNQSVVKNATSTKGNQKLNNTHFGYGHNSPPEWARELFKPSKDS